DILLNTQRATAACSPWLLVVIPGGANTYKCSPLPPVERRTSTQSRCWTASRTRASSESVIPTPVACPVIESKSYANHPLSRFFHSHPVEPIASARLSSGYRSLKSSQCGVEYESFGMRKACQRS